MSRLGLLVGALLWSVTLSSQAAIPASERAVLEAVYAQTDGDHWAWNENWLGLPGTECTWRSVTCDASESHVVKIDLGTASAGSGNGGTLPKLDGLAELTVFSAPYAKLSGTIPPLAGLPKLQTLDLSNNQLTGEIPPLVSLVNLRSLNLANNRLTGSLPSLSGLANLQIVVLRNNRLSGSIPPLTNLSALQNLALDNNQFTGNIPSFGGLVRLNSLELQNNLFDGPVPALNQLSVLAALNLANNRLSGAIPEPPSPTKLTNTTLCPNLIDRSPSSAWDAILGEPWYRNCGVPTRLRINLPTSTATLGVPLDFTVSALTNGNAGLPTGLIEVFDAYRQTVLCSSMLTNGVANCSVAFTEPRVYSLGARYAGDRRYQAADGLDPGANGSTVSVNQFPAAITLSSTLNPSQAQQSIGFVATVSAHGLTGGSVTFSVDDAVANACNKVVLSGAGDSRTATCTVGPLSEGSHSVVAYYQEDINNNGIRSAKLTQVVLPQSSAIPVVALISSVGNATYGQSIVLTATVVGSHPTGSMSFREGDTPLCNAVPVIGNGDAVTAVCTLSKLEVGRHVLQVRYSGDALNPAQTSSDLIQDVMQAATDLSVSLSATSATAGTPVSAKIVLVAMPPGAGQPSGTVDISTGQERCTVVLPASTCSLTPSLLGRSTVTARYSGDRNFTGNTATAEFIASGVSLTSSMSRVVPGLPFTLSANVYGEDPSGTLVFLDGTTPLCSSVPVKGFGGRVDGQCTNVNLAAGTHTLTVSYSGDSKNPAAISSPMSLISSPIATTVLLSAKSNPIVLGNNLVVNAKLQWESPGYGYTGTLQPTGSIVVTDGTKSCSINYPGRSSDDPSCTFKPSNTGTKSISAIYSGDASFTPSSGQMQVSVLEQRSPTSITVSASPNPSTYGQTVTLKAVVSGANLTGTTHFYEGSEGSRKICDSPTYILGGPACYPSSLTAGNHTITAVYEGDENNAPSTAAPITLTINKADLNLTVNVAPSPAVAGASAEATVAASTSGIYVFPSGTAKIMAGGATCDAPWTYRYIQTKCLLTPTQVGSAKLTATYEGDSNFNPATATAAINIAPAIPGSTTLASSQSPALSAQSIRFTATVIGSSPTGTITFFDGTAPTRCQAVLLSPTGNSAQALCDLKDLTPGPHLISARYGGDSNNPVSVSNILTQEAIGPSVTQLASSKNPSEAGDWVTFTAQVSAIDAANSVSFYDGTDLVCQYDLSGGISGQIQTSTYLCSVRFDSPGTHNFSAVYSGSRYATASASSNVLVQQVGERGPVNLNQLGLTGSWYNPLTSGQGLLIETYPNLHGPGKGELFGGWFTFDAAPTGGQEKQRWYSLQGPMDSENANMALTIYSGSGGIFNAPPRVPAHGMGQATLRFDDCMHGSLSYRFDDGSGRRGNVPLTRLNPNVTCTASGGQDDTPGTYGLSGSWYDPETSGQGFLFVINPTYNQLFAGWYTYAPSGSGTGTNQRWYSLQGHLTDTLVGIDIPIFTATKGEFDSPGPVIQSKVGNAKVRFKDCNSAIVNYSFTAGENSGMNGTVNLKRTGPAPIGCATQ